MNKIIYEWLNSYDIVCHLTIDLYQLHRAIDKLEKLGLNKKIVRALRDQELRMYDRLSKSAYFQEASEVAEDFMEETILEEERAEAKTLGFLDDQDPQKRITECHQLGNLIAGVSDSVESYLNFGGIARALSKISELINAENLQIDPRKIRV